MTTTLLKTSDLPQSFAGTESRRKTTHKRNARLIRKHGGRLTTLAKLPPESQKALIHYMSVDGAAWAAELNEDFTPTDPIKGWKWGEGTPYEPKLRKQMLADIDKYLPEFIRLWGDYKIGTVDIPLDELIQSVLKDNDMPEDAFTKGKVDSSWEYKAPTWPVILSAFDSETLQDGWTRLGRYHDLGVEKVTCLWYPGSGQ